MRRNLLLLLCLCALLALGGCANAANTEWVLDPPQPAAVLSAQPEAVSYPIDSPERISVTIPAADVEGLTRAEEYTGIGADFTVISPMGAAEAVKQMVDAQNFTDLFYGYGQIGIYTYLDYGDEIAMDLTELIGRCAPNYLAAIRDDPILSRTAMVGEYGEMYAFVQINEGSAAADYGPYIRADWLEELGLDMPATYEDYHAVLAAFRERYGCAETFGMQPTGAIPGDYPAAGYGVTAYTSGSDMASVGFYAQDGQVKYGPAEAGFWDYLSMLAGWRAEGLFSTDFVTWSDVNTYEKLVLNDQMGVFYTYASRAEGLAGNLSGGGRLAPIPDAALTPGAERHLGGQNNRRTGMTTLAVYEGSPRAELCVRWCDFWYGDVGTQLVNYGAAGDTLPAAEDSAGLCGFLPGIYDQSLQLVRATGAYRAAAETWTTDNSWRIPADLPLSDADQQRFAILAQGLTTTVTVWSTQIIAGERPLDCRDEFLAELDKNGLQKCLDCLTAYLKLEG